MSVRAASLRWARLKRSPFEDQALYFAALGTLAARGSARGAIEGVAQACRLEPGSAVAHANHGMALLDQAAGALDDEPRPASAR